MNILGPIGITVMLTFMECFNMTMLELDRHTSILLERLVIAIEEQNCLQIEMNERLSAIQSILDNYNL